MEENNIKNRKIERKCLGCNRVFDREELIKITKLKNGTLKINPTSKELGRSVYVCKNSECVKNLIKKKRIKTGLRYSNFDEIEKIGKILTAMVEV